MIWSTSNFFYDIFLIISLFILKVQFLILFHDVGLQPNRWCSPCLKVEWQHVLPMARQEVGRLM